MSSVSGVGGASNPYQNRIGQMRPSQTTQAEYRGPDGGNNLYRGSSIIPESAFVDADIVTVTPENIGSLGGDVLLTPQQTRELYEKGSLQVRREFQTAESNEGFMSITAKLAAAIVGPSRSVAAIQIDPLFLEMIKDPNAKVGMGYTRVEKETWTVLPSPEERRTPEDPPIIPPREPVFEPVPVHNPERRNETVTQPENGETPGPAGKIYRIARTPGEADRNSHLVQQYTSQGYPSLGNGEQVGDTTYDGATAEAILGREMQVPFQYVGRASLNFNNPNLPGAVSFNEKMASKLGFRYAGIAENGEALILNRDGKRVDGKAYKDAVAKEMGLGNFENFQNLQEHVKFTQAVGYTDELNATALYGQVAKQSPDQVQRHLRNMHDGFSLDNTRHEYFTASDLRQFPTGEGRTRLDDYRDATQNTPIPNDYLDEYQALYNSKNGTNLSLDDIRAANPSMMDMYALHAQTFQPSLGITFSNGKANVPEGSVDSVLNARIVLEANTSNGGEDQLLYGEDSVNIINDRVAQQFGGVTNMELRVADGNGQQTTVPAENIVEFLQFHDSSSHANAGADSIFNDVEADITQRYNAGTGGEDYTTVGNGFIPVAVDGGGGTVITGPTPASINAAINDNLNKLNAPGLSAESKQALLAGIEEQIQMLPPEQRGAQTLQVNGQSISPQDWLSDANGIRTQVIATADQEWPKSTVEGIHANTHVAETGGNYPPGTADRLMAEISGDIEQLEAQLQAAGDKPIMVTTAPPESEEIQLTPAYLEQLKNKAVMATDAMRLQEGQMIENNPQLFTPGEDGEPQLRSGIERANESLNQVKDYIRQKLRGGDITPEDQQELGGVIDSSSRNIFQALQEHGVVSGAYSPAAVTQVTPAQIREAVTDPAQAEAMIGAVENLKSATTMLGIVPELNLSAGINDGIHSLSQRTEVNHFENVELATKAFAGELKRVAELDDPAPFNSFMQNVYNLPAYDANNPTIAGHYDTLRAAASDGSLLTPPNIVAVDRSELNGANGAYVGGVDGGPGEIRVANDILQDQTKLNEVITEELFHHIEHHESVQGLNGGQETAGDEGRAALRALMALQSNPDISAADLASRAQEGRGEATAVQSGGNIHISGDDAGTIRENGQNRSIEFNATAQPSAQTPTEEQPPAQQSYTERLQNTAGVDMEIPDINPNPTRPMEEVSNAEAFNYVDPVQGQTPAPNEEAEGTSKMGQIVEGLPGLFKGWAAGTMQRAEALYDLAEKLFKQGVANNLGNASSLMNTAQSLNGYFNERPNFDLPQTAANYSLRPEYGDQNPETMSQGRDKYYNDHNRQRVQRDQANAQSAESRAQRVNDDRRSSTGVQSYT